LGVTVALIDWGMSRPGPPKIVLSSWRPYWARIVSELPKTPS
jgi:hypothetical protein